MDVNRRGYWGVLPGEIKRDTELTIAARYLYAILSSMAYEDGYCWPSNEYLAEEIGLSKRRVVELLAKLRERGYIQISMRPCDSSHTGERRYIYCGMFPGRSALDGGCEESQGEGAKSRAGGCEISQGEGAENRTQYISRKINKKDNPLPPKNSVDEITSVFDNYAGEDADLRQRLSEFLESRRKNKKPLHTQRAAKILVNKLDRLSDGDRAVKLALLDNAILHNWDSVYPLKEDERPGAQPNTQNTPLRGKGVTYL